MLKERLSVFGQKLKIRVFVLGAFVLGIWLLASLDSLVLRGALQGLGVRPRTLAGLSGILVAPLIHAGFAHAGANTLPFVVLGLLVSTRGLASFAAATAGAWLGSGIGIWLIGSSESVHVGLSGVIFGYLGYLLLRGILERSAVAIALLVAATALYGGMLLGVLPGQAGISWEGHLFGFVGGGLAAWLGSRLSAHPSAGKEPTP